jgi:hypothetical protein
MTVEGHLWGSTVLEKVQTLELEGGPKLDNEVLLTMAEGLKRCPNLRRLLVGSNEEAPEMEGKHDMTCFVKLVCQFSHVKSLSFSMLIYSSSVLRCNSQFFTSQAAAF